MPKWDEITVTDEYKSLPPQAQAEVKTEWFKANLLPEVEKLDSLREMGADKVYEWFMQQPDDTGEGIVRSTLGSAIRGFGEIVPGTLEGVGALTGITPISDLGESAREGLEYIAPVNPIYEQGIPAKVANVAGNVASIIGTSGVGGLVGKALGSGRAATAGSAAARQALTNQAIQAGAKSALYGTGFAQGAAAKAAENERLGITGVGGYMNLLGGGASELLPELLPFGSALETSAARRLLGGVDDAAGRVIPGIRMSAAQEAAEGGSTQVLSNLSTQLTAPTGVEAPGLFEGAGEAALWEGVGGAMFGAINKLGRTPPERQTAEQKAYAAELGAIPVNSKPPITPEESLENFNQGGIPVVSLDGAVTTLPFNRDDIRATNLPFNRDDIRATDLPFSREDIRPTQLPFNREDIRATELPFSRQNIRGLSQLGQSVPSPSQVIADTLLTNAVNVSSDATKATEAALAVVQGVAATTPVELPVPTVAPTVETPSVKDLVDAGMPQDEAAAERQAQLEATTPKRPLTDLTDEELEQRIQDSSRLANETAVEGSPDAAFFTNAAEKYRAEKARRVAATTQAAAPAPATEAPPITPTQETPTPATEGTVMPGGSAMERDVTKPEQMTPGEVFDSFNKSPSPSELARLALETKGDVGRVHPDASGSAIRLAKDALKEIENIPSKDVELFVNGASDTAVFSKMIYRARHRVGQKGGKAALVRALSRISDTDPLDLMERIASNRELTEIINPINIALAAKKPVSAAAVDAYGIPLPSGYVKQGDLYVFQPEPSPQTTTVATPTETAAPLAKEAAVASVVQQPAEGSIPAVEQESATTAIESNEKADIADAAMAFLEEDLTESKRQWSPEKIAAAKAYFASGGKDMDVLRAAFPKLVGSRPIVQAYLKADKEASEAQAKRDAADAKLAKEIERDEKEQAKAEAAQKKREELNLKTLNSLIQKTRTNVVQGTVKATDANQAVAILNRSGEIPNVLFTWIGTSKDFLADPANRVRYPETWAAVSANSKIEGMSENGQPIVFTDNVGVSDLDRKLANLQGTTPEVAAVRRVILHENIHKGMFFLSMKEKMQVFSFLRRMYSPQELDSLAESYSEYADWRTNQVSYFSILEEAMTRDFDSMVEIPRDGIWAEFMQFLRGIWQKITGKTSEPTLKDYKDVFRLIRNSLKNSEKANADMLVNGGGVRIGIASKVEYDSPNDAAFNSGAEVARNTDYDERDKEVRSTIRAAYDIAPKTNGPSVPLDELFSIVKQSMPDLTETEFSRILQGLYEDSGALLIEGESPFATFTTEGERAGSAIIMPPTDMTKDDVISMLRGMSAANPAPSGEINQELYDTVLTQLRNFISNGGRVPLPIQSYGATKAGRYNYTRQKDGLERDLRQGSGIGRPGQIDTGAPFRDKVERENLEIQRIDSEVSRNRETTTEGRENRKREAGARPNVGMAGSGYTFADYAQIASRIGARVQEVSNDIGGGLAAMADGNGATTILINATQLGKRVAGTSFGLDEDGAIETIGNALVEELIHAADLAVQREAWIASGRRKPFTEFATNSDKSMLDEMREVVASSNDPVKATQILHDAIQASRQLYESGAAPSDIDKFFASEPRAISSVMSEFVRQMIQQDMHQTVSEASLFRRFIERVMKMLQKIRDAIAPAKAGEFGDILKNRINETEMMLAMAYQQTGARASMIDPEDAATKQFAKNIKDINSGTAKAPFGGVQFTNFKPIDREVKSAEEYSDNAIKYVNNLEKEGVSLDDIANSVISPAFLESIGIEQDLMAQDALTIEVRQRVDNAAREEKSPGRKKQLSKLSERLSAFWQGVGSKKGQHLGQRRYLVNKARYSWMFIREIAEKAMKEARTNILISNFGSENATSFTQNSYADSDKANQQAVDENINAAEEAQEFDQDAADLAAGEATLTGAFLKLYEDLKDLLRQNGLIAKARASRVANAAKASISDTERNAIMSMSDAELNALESKNNKRIGEILNTLLGKEEAADTTEKKTVRKKREKMVEVVRKRLEQGKTIDFSKQIDSLFTTENPQRDEIIDDVSNALLQAAKKRGVKPSQKTALADLVASIKSLLKANIKGEDLKADEAPLGQLLARTYLDNLTATEAKLFTESWNDGRKKVRAMLTEMGVEGNQLEAELNAIMPATPTIAYNPSAVRKAITRALREAGLDANDLLANTQSVKSEILKVWDNAAVDAGLTPSVWQEGRKLAEKSIDEFVIERKASKEKAKQIAKVVSDQANNPVSLADFSNSLSQFKLNDSKVKELFDKAKVLANKKVQIANDRAIRVLFEAENNLAQSAFFNSTTKPDTIVKAFREQVSDPMSRQDFKARMDAMKVSGELSDRLFDRAAREKDNAQWKRAQDMLEGPNALRNILREINRARPGEQAPLSKQIPWRQLLSQSAKTVEEYRQRIFDAISANEELKNATPEQKARLADLFAEAWESNRTRILDGMLERMIRAEEAKKNLSKEGAKALQAQRMRIVEDINLGIFDNDELAKRMAEKFGIKSEFTETEREKINSLIEVLQDEELNAVKRQVAAYKLLEVLQGELKIPVAKMLADFWVSSVLSGPNTIVSIGLAVASGAFELSTALSRVFIAGFTNPKQLPSELAGAYKTLARLLSAYGRQANIAWQYLVSGDPVFLDPSMNDVTENMQWGNIGKSNKLAEQMAKSDKILVKSAGLFMRTVSRLLTALDVFNSGLTKEGSLSIVFRQIGLDPEKIAALEKKSDLKPYKEAIIQKDFGGTPPKSARDKAILDSYALADMMAELDKLGNVSENANFFGQQGAMTLDPSGLGGVGYRAIRSLVTNAEAGADRFLKQAQRGWNDSAQNGDRILSGLELAFAYFMQFAAYNAANFGGVRFARFAGNKFNQGLSFIPGIGFARAFEAEFDPNRISGKEAFIDSIRRNQLIGVMLSVAGYQILKAIADEPDDEKRGWFINGGWGNLTPEKKQQKLAAGEKEYTIGINGKVFNYANWPISSALAAIGSLSDLIRFSPDQWNDKNVAQIMASAAMSGAAAAADIPALSQFQELFGNSLSSKDPNEKRMERFAKVMSSYAGGFVPRFLKDIDYAQDPNLRKYETLWEKTASHIPVYRRYEGKEYYDILGQQIQRNVYPGSREFMVKPTDPAYKVLGALNSRGIWLTPANAEHRMVGKGARRRSLTQEEADNYSLETGKGYKQMLLRYGQRALQMPTERARAFLLDKADEVRDRALKKVYRGYQPA